MLRYIPSLHKYILYILYVYSFFTSYTYILFFLIIIYIYLYICKLVQFRLICRNYLNLGSFVRQVRIYFNISLRESRILSRMLRTSLTFTCYTRSKYAANFRSLSFHRFILQPPVCHSPSHFLVTTIERSKSHKQGQRKIKIKIRNRRGDEENL